MPSSPAPLHPGQTPRHPPLDARPLVLVLGHVRDAEALLHDALNDSCLLQRADEADAGLAMAMAKAIGTTPPDLLLLDSAALLRAPVLARLRQKHAGDLARSDNQRVRDELAQRTAQLTAIQDVTTLVMASMAETRGAETSNHIRRTQHHVKALAWRLCTHPRFAAELTPGNIELLFRSAAPHDIGKAGIPDRILLKPGKLSPEEFETMKPHTTLGHDAIASAKLALGVDVNCLNCAREIACSHHEKWNGSGYSDGLAGDAIPISGRLMALADVYDALISRRVHKEAMAHEQAIAIIQQTRGRHFDPDVVDAFMPIEDHFRAIASAYADTQDDLRKKVDCLGIAQVWARQRSSAARSCRATRPWPWSRSRHRHQGQRP